MIDSEDKGTIDRRIRWLLSFQYQDLKGSSENDLKHLAGQLVGLSDVAPRLQGYSLRQLSLSGEDWDKLPVLSKRQIQNIQKKLRAGLSDLMSEDHTEGDGFKEQWNKIKPRVWEIPQIRYEGMSLMRFPGKRLIFPRPNIKFPGAFWLSVATLLAEAGPRLQRCTECKTIFLAKTSRKACCSDSCSQKGRNRRFTEKKSPEEKYEIRRATYVRQIQLAHPKAKIQKRGLRGKITPRKEES